MKREGGVGRYRGGAAAAFFLVLGWLVLVPSQAASAADPKWTVTAPMPGGARVGHSMTVLSGPACAGDIPAAHCGKVLVAGGSKGPNAKMASVLLYDPKTDQWTDTSPPLNEVRSGHEAVTLIDGQVLIVGGSGNEAVALGSAETYDPATGRWTPTLPMNTPRLGHSATLLSKRPGCEPNCGQVLATGGADAATQSAELYDPATRTWTPVGALTTPRQGHSATELPSGKVLLAGSGDRSPVDCTVRASCPGLKAELFDPLSRTFTPTGDMKVHMPGRYGHASALLPGGRVLVVAGEGARPTGTTDVYQPDGTWVEAQPVQPDPNADDSQRLKALLPLPNERFLAGPGVNSGTADIYDSRTGQWAPTDALNERRREGAPMVLLDCTARSGRALTAGGQAPDPDTALLDSVELYNRVPTLQRVARIAGAAAGGRVPVRLHGLAFDSGQTVKVSFGGADVPGGVVKASGKQIDVMAPITPGPVPVTVTVDGIPADTCGKNIQFQAAACPETGEVALGPTSRAQPNGSGPAAAGAAGTGLLNAGLALSAWATAANQRRRRRRAARSLTGRTWPRQRRRADQSGFTLVELLVVVAILGILSAVVVFAVRGADDKGQEAAVQTDERTIRTALEVFCAQNGRYPATGDPMGELVPKYLGNPSEYHTLQTGEPTPFPAQPPNTPPIDPEGNCPGGGPTKYKIIPTLPPINPNCP